MLMAMAMDNGDDERQCTFSQQPAMAMRTQPVQPGNVGTDVESRHRKIRTPPTSEKGATAFTSHRFESKRNTPWRQTVVLHILGSSTDRRTANTKEQRCEQVGQPKRNPASNCGSATKLKESAGVPPQNEPRHSHKLAVQSTNKPRRQTPPQNSLQPNMWQTCILGIRHPPRKF